MIVRKSILYSILSLLYLYIASIIYYAIFTSNWEGSVDKPSFCNSEVCDNVIMAFNRDFLLGFLPLIYNAEVGVIRTPFNWHEHPHIHTNLNNYGISYLHFYFSKIFYLGNDYILNSLYFNLIVFTIVYILIFKICNILNINKNRIHLILLINTPIIYYTQAINKEPLTILFYFLVIYLLLKRRIILLSSFVIIFSMIRIHHCLIAFYIYFLYGSKNSKSLIIRIIILYCISSILAPLITNGKWIWAKEYGVSLLIHELNNNYYIGTLLLGYIKVIQIFYSLFKSTFTFIEDGYINMYLIKDVLPNIAILLFYKNIINKFTHRLMYHKEKILCISVIAYLLFMIIAPIIHIRYCIPIFITLVILGLNKQEFPMYYYWDQVIKKNNIK